MIPPPINPAATFRIKFGPVRLAVCTIALSITLTSEAMDAFYLCGDALNV